MCVCVLDFSTKAPNIGQTAVSKEGQEPPAPQAKHSKEDVDSNSSSIQV